MERIKARLFGNRHHIGRRLIVYIIAFSSAITLLITAVQLVFEYQDLRRGMDRTLDGVGIYVPSLSSSLWDFDEKQIQLALAALSSLPDIEYAKVTGTDGKLWSAGPRPAGRVIMRSYPLRHLSRGQDQHIGTLEVAGSLDALYGHVLSRALSIAASNALKTFLVVIFMVIMLRRVVTRRLERLADKVSQLVPTLLPLRKMGERDPEPMPSQLDELDAVAWAFDKTSRDLRLAVEELNRLNQNLERHVADRTTQLETANRDLQAFGYTLSHDLKAPLITLASFSAILKEQHAGQLDEKGQQYLARILAAARRMDAIVADTLQLFKASACALESQPVDLSRIAGEVMEELARGQPARAVDCQIEEGMQAQGDPQLLRVALENLLGNAWKYTAKKARAHIRLGRFEAEDGQHGFVVEDNGAGFDMAHAGRLFEPFHRLHKEVDFPGNGVGLTTVQKIIQRHNGRIWAEAQPGKGARFFFTVAIAQGA